MSPEGQELCCGHIKFEMPIRHADGEVRKADGRNVQAQPAARAEALHWESVLMDSLKHVDGQGSGLSHAEDSFSKQRAEDREEGGQQESQTRVLGALAETGPFRKCDGGHCNRLRMPCLHHQIRKMGEWITVRSCGCGLLRRRLGRGQFSLSIYHCTLSPMSKSTKKETPLM